MKRNVIEFRVDENTGEVLKATPGVFTPQEDLEKWHEFYRVREKFKEQGAFVWLLYKKVEELKVPVSPANLTRLIYLSTFMNYNNRLIRDTPSDPLNIEEALNKEQLIEIMQLSKNTFYQFYKEVTENNILIDTESGYYLNDKFFKKGSVRRKGKNGRMRIYISGIRELYKKAQLKDHKMLGYGFMLIPYTNIEYNIVCWNPDEENIDFVRPIDIDDLMTLFGYDLHNIKRFTNNLMNVMVDKYQLLHLVDNKRFFVSPKAYYAGKNRDRVEVLGGFDIREVKRKDSK